MKGGSAGADWQIAMQRVAEAADSEEVARAAQTLIDQFPARLESAEIQAVERVLHHLQSAAPYPYPARVAELAIRAGGDTGLIRCYQAQQLIGQKLIQPAIDTLRAALARGPHTRAFEQARLNGLLGRCHKQLYDDARRASGSTSEFADLHKAVHYYAAGYFDTIIYATEELGDDSWEANVAEWWYCAINLVACLQLARRAGCKPEAGVNSEAIAHQIIKVARPRVDSVGRKDPWLFATIAEAFVGIGKLSDAAEWYGRYVEHPEIKPFYVDSSLRQLRDIWGFGESAPEQVQILDALKMRQARMPQGFISLGHAERQRWRNLDPQKDRILEAILGENGPVTLHLIRGALARVDAVGCVVPLKGAKKRHGTAFAMRGESLHDDWRNLALVLTSSHVVGTPYARSRDEHPAFQPSQAAVMFEEGPHAEKRIPVKLLWESKISELDAAVLELKLDDVQLSADELSYLDILSDGSMPDSKSHLQYPSAYVIGHPDSSELAISLHDNKILDLGFAAHERMQDIFIHYMTPTQRGNSGSPVFFVENDGSWVVAALHRSGPKSPQQGRPKLNGAEGYIAANEGATLRSIREQIAADLSKRPKPSA